MAIKEDIASQAANAGIQMADVYYQVLGKYSAPKKYGGYIRTRSYFYEGSSLERAFVNAKAALNERDGKAKLIVQAHNKIFRMEIELFHADLVA